MGSKGKSAAGLKLECRQKLTLEDVLAAVVKAMRPKAPVGKTHATA